MIRLLTGNGRSFQVSFIFWTWLTCLTAVASLTVEERLEVLEATNLEIKKILTAKSERLVVLENEVQQLKSTVVELKKEREKSNLVREKREGNGISQKNQTTKKNAILRTCSETLLYDPLLPSGLYWIDPDGQGFGDDPIQVYCDMTTGKTSILHDSELPTIVGRCADPGCYSTPIKYFATKRQMASLIELSNECHQSFRYDCNYAPFEMGNIAFSWWNDRNGNPQYFWAGNNASVHTCQCGIDRNCTKSTTKCNCNSLNPLPDFDSGVITSKNLLPVTQLNFGRPLLDVSYAVFTLGRFECSGQVTAGQVNGMPSSCSDLRRIGHSLNGLYSVMGANSTTMVKTVFCDFAKLPNESGFQTSIVNVDDRPSPVSFYVHRKTNFGLLNAAVPFEVEKVNIGGAMNLTTGIFTAPRNGVYFFVFSALSRFSVPSAGELGINFILNDKSKVGSCWADSGTGSGAYYGTLSLQSTLQLKAGDRLLLKIVTLKNAYLHDNENYFTQFSGHLLQEDISQS